MASLDKTNMLHCVAKGHEFYSTCFDFSGNFHLFSVFILPTESTIHVSYY